MQAFEHLGHRWIRRRHQAFIRSFRSLDDSEPPYCNRTGPSLLAHVLIGKFCCHPQPYRNCLERTNGDFLRAVPKKRRSAIDCIQTDGTGQRFPLFSITPTEIEINMKSFISSIALAGVVVAAPVFASGYGPAPKYASSDGAPASQRGQSAQTLAVERKAQTTQETEYNTTPDAQFSAGNKTARSTASNQF